MAVPGSGTLSLRRLANEKIDDDYAGSGTPTMISLSDLTTGTGHEYENTNTNATSYPNSTAPHSMGEWYSYDHDEGNRTFLSSSNAKSSSVCGATINQTYYHDGGGDFPVTGDIVYTNVAGTSTLNPGNYSVESYYFVISSGGVVDSTVLCF